MGDCSSASIPVCGLDQLSFALVVTEKLRESRHRQNLTQAQVAHRTNGLVSKAALANYETGHRSLRIEVLWVIARALGEDLGRILADVEREVIGSFQEQAPSSIGLRVDWFMQGSDHRLDPVRRWIELRQMSAPNIPPAPIVTLDYEALKALADLMLVSVVDLRRMLTTPDGELHAV